MLYMYSVLAYRKQQAGLVLIHRLPTLRWLQILLHTGTLASQNGLHHTHSVELQQSC